MIRQDLDYLRRQFEAVNSTIASQLSEANPHVVALVAKWDKADLVPGLSDLDYRIICDDDTRPDDWIEIDRSLGQIHLDMVSRHPEWNRINEHLAGAGMTVSEVLDDRFHNPEYVTWSLWWGCGDWYDALMSQVRSRPFDATDEHFHLIRFLSYYAPYDARIDPPINLGPLEHKYGLHSRCWHYFAPPLLSAASLLARRNFRGKTEGLRWLRDNGHAERQADAVLRQVDAHYETPELTDPERTKAFEDLLFTAFEELIDPVCGSVESLTIDHSRTLAEKKKQLNLVVPDRLNVVMDSTRFARIRAGRYYFYLNAPNHFEARALLTKEFDWLKKFTEPVFASLRTILGDHTLSPQECLTRFGLGAEPAEMEAVRFTLDMAGKGADNDSMCESFSRAVEIFPRYCRILEEVLQHLTDLEGGVSNP